MSRVIVTGGTGFVGSELVPLLVAAGHDVHLVGRSHISVDGCTVHRCDLLTDEPKPLLRRIAADSLIHLAWYAKPGAFWDARENIAWTAASLRLVEAFADAHGKRAVIAGTCAEYDWSFHRLDEMRTPLRPNTLYGNSKASLFRLLSASPSQLGLSIVWARIFFPYGPHEQPGRLFSSIVDGIAADVQVDCSAGLQSRDFIHVHDVARAFAMLLDSEVEGPINIASGETVQVREFVKAAARLAGGETLINFGARPTRPGEPHYMAAAATRLQDELGFCLRFDLAAGLSEAVRRRLALVRQRELD